MTNLAEITQEKLTLFWENFISFIPNMVGALIVLILGWIVAVAIGKIVAGLLYRLRFNEPFKSEKWAKAMEEANIEVNPSDFVGKVSKWLVIILVIWIMAAVLQLEQVSDFVGEIIAYIPNVIAAIIILVIAVMVGEILSKLVVAATEKSDFPYSRIAGTIVKVSIWVVAAFAILIQLGIAEELLKVIFTGLIAFLVIAGGLAFGLGGKDMAGKVLENTKKSVSQKK